MMNARIERLEKRKVKLIVAVGCLLAALALALVFIAGPAWAAPGDCGDVDCGGGGDPGDTTPPDTTINTGPPTLN